MKLFLTTVLLAPLAAWCATDAAAGSEQAARPNIVLILADDLGYGDLSCQGATRLKTPNIDRLAKEGIRLTDAHAPSGLCCPTRYGLMTGRYPWRRPTTTWASPGAPLLIEPGRLTLASVLKQAGYATGLVGKWHLGYGDKDHRVTWNDELKPGPLECGFDSFFGHDNNRDLNVENHRVAGLDPAHPLPTGGAKRADEKSQPLADPSRNALTLHERALAFVDQKQARKPFFLYYAPNNVHVPLRPTARFRGSSGCGLYGDFVQELDWSVGELLDALDRHGLAGHTLVIFTSDNGARCELEAVKAGHRSNAPLNGQKGDAWEGGNRVPFLARWPGHIQAGAVSGRLLCLTDLLATFAAITGQRVPAGAGEDSVSALPLLLGAPATAADRQNLIVQSRAASWAERKRHNEDERWAVREGDWLLVRGQGSGLTTSLKPGGKENFAGFAELSFTNSDYTVGGTLKPGAPS